MNMALGREGEVFEVANEEFQEDSMKMKGLSDLFMGARKLYAARLDGGGTNETTEGNVYYGGILSQAELMEIKQR